jgi:hypothetical protein
MPKSKICFLKLWFITYEGESVNRSQTAIKGTEEIRTWKKHLFIYGRHFDYWNQPPNTRMRGWYLNRHQVGLCCYLVIQIENPLLPLLLFYSHLWPIYWLFLVCSRSVIWCVRARTYMGVLFSHVLQHEFQVNSRFSYCLIQVYTNL